MKNKFSKAIKLWQDNRLYSILMVMATALIITFCMVLYMVFVLQNGDNGAESQRSRVLYSDQGYSYNVEKNSDYGRGMSSMVAKELFGDMKGVEEVSLTTSYFTADDYFVGTSQENSSNRKVRFVDDAFFRIYKFDFIEGAPFTKEQSDAARNEIIITDKLAKTIFGTTDVLNKTLLIRFRDYRIVGVVKSVSSLYTHAHSDVWATFNPEDYNWWDDAGELRGAIRVALLLEKGTSKNQVREELAKRLEILNTKIKPYTFDLNVKSVDEQLVVSQDSENWKSYSFNTISVGKLLIILGLIILFIPTINMAGIIASQVSKRAGEIGVRKAYGATDRKVLWLFFRENLFLTIVGGILGLILSILALFLFKQTFVGSTTTLGTGDDFVLPWNVLLSPSVFLILLLFCFIVNSLATITPVWMALRKSITNTLKSA